eukprot:CCRYP_016682-RG/>CCRYP_016682-RG protein AED:0.50 eAED:0.50 QI:0/-1/0/1/-1/0/1/0/16
MGHRLCKNIPRSLQSS